MYNRILSKYVNNELRGDYSGYGLESIELLLAHLGNPHLSFKSVHIAGTNGKGTTSNLISSVLYSCGYKTGLYTSPHLLKINERIKVNGEEISDEDIYKYALKIDNIITSNKKLMPTYFDILTAIAFMHFSHSSTEIAVIETGLGGKLDSTNVINPLVSVITEISLDHTSVLGETIELIAAEKAGIIKDSVPVISLCTSEDSSRVIESAAYNKKAPLYKTGRDFRTDNIEDTNSGYKFNYFLDKQSEKLDNIILNLRPRHQLKNAAAALTALILLRDKGFPEITSSAVYDVFKNSSFPGRFQILKRSPLILFDAAHNYEALRNLFDAIEVYYGERRLKIVFSIMADKMNKDVQRILYEKRDSILYFSFEDNRLYVPLDGEFNQMTGEVDVLTQYVSSSDENDLILFTGTFRLYKYALDVISRI